MPDAHDNVADTEPDLYQQYPDLARLVRVLRRSEGGFSLFFAECNLSSLRQQLAAALTARMPSPPVSIDLSQFDTDAETIDEIISQQVKNNTSTSPIFLFGLEQLLPTLSSDKLRSTVQQLNWRRGGLSRLQRPLLIWLPRYALDLLAEQTPDFYDWYSGVFNFPVKAEKRKQSEQAAFRSLRSDTGIHAAEYMNSAEKKRWLGTLKELLQEHPEADKEKAILLGSLGRLLCSMGDNEKAFSHYQQSLKIRQEIGDKAGEGVTLNNISQIYHDKRDYDTALKYLQQSLAIRQEIDDKCGEGITLSNISQIYYDRRDYDTALKHLKQSLAIQLEIGDKAGEGTTLNNISLIYYTLGDYDTALTHLQQASIVQHEIDNIAGLCTTLFNIGHIYRQNENDDEAVNTWTRAYQLAKKINSTQTLDALEKLTSQLGLEGGLDGWERLATQTSFPDRKLSRNCP